MCHPVHSWLQVRKLSHVWYSQPRPNNFLHVSMIHTLRSHSRPRLTLISQIRWIIRKLLHSCWKLVSPSHFHSIRNLKWTNHWAIIPLICPTAFKSERTTWELPKCQLNPPTFTASLHIIGGLNVPCNCFHHFGDVFPTFRAAICSHLDWVYLKGWPKNGC